MDLKTARIWQDVLLWGGAVVSLVGAWGFQNTVAALVGLMMMGASLIVWWRFYRCPYCHEQLGRGNPKALPKMRRVDRRRAGARGEEKDPAQEKRSTERTRRPR